jgi:hypothetical protein
LFQSAYENRYTWSHGFPGYQAAFSLTTAYDTAIGRGGDQILPAGTYTGRVAVPADLTDLNSIQVMEETHSLAAVWIANHIKDVITHRQHCDFEAAHGQHQFFLEGEADSTGAVPIRLVGDAMGSHYKVRDRQIVQVARAMGGMAFTINHLEKLDTPSGYLSTRYTAVFTNPETGKVINQLRFSDSYTELGGFYLMTRQRIEGQTQGKPTQLEVTFSHLRLTQPCN